MICHNNRIEVQAYVSDIITFIVKKRFKENLQWLRRGVRTAVSGLDMITTPGHFWGGYGDGMRIGVPGGRAICHLVPMKRELSWPGNTI
jgi:hypothetical protein